MDGLEQDIPDLAEAFEPEQATNKLKRKLDDTDIGTAPAAPSNDEIRSQLIERDDARKAKEWDKADAIKNDLRSRGVFVREEKGAKGGTWTTSDGRCGSFSTDSTTGFTFETSIATQRVEEMLETRHKARKMKDWDTADRIKNELRLVNISVNDEESLWVARDGRQGRFGDARHRGLPTALPAAGGQPYIMPQMPWPTNPMQAPQAMMRVPPAMMQVPPWSDSRTAEINQLLMHREEARRARDWAAADGIKAQLRSEGVDINDAQGTWSTADGRSGRSDGRVVSGGGSLQQRMVNALGQQPAMASTSVLRPQSQQEMSAPSTDEINYMLYTRTDARKRKDWDTADMIKNQLRASGVDVNDKAGTWSTMDGRSGSVEGSMGQDVAPGMPGPQHQQEVPRGTSGPSTDEINYMLYTRTDARKRKDWDTADMIKNQLRASGVDVNDKAGTWSTMDGRSGSVEGSMGQSTAQYIQAAHPMGYAYPYDLGVSQMRSYGGGQMMGSPVVPPGSPPVPVVPMISHSIPPPQQISGGTSGPSTDEINYMLYTRTDARKRKDWDTADMIKNQLRASGVDVNDKAGTWSTMDGRSGIIEGNSY